MDCEERLIEQARAIKESTANASAVWICEWASFLPDRMF